jgi:hypothetical protein
MYSKPFGGILWDISKQIWTYQVFKLLFRRDSRLFQKTLAHNDNMMHAIAFEQPYLTMSGPAKSSPHGSPEDASIVSLNKDSRFKKSDFLID